MCRRVRLEHRLERLPRPSTAKASAYLRRFGGASALVIQVDGFGIGIADPYPSAPTLRFSIPPDTRGPAQLTVIPDASDVRGPVRVDPGTAWLIYAPGVTPGAAGDGWRFGRGTMSVSSLSLPERDTDERDFVDLEAVMDLGGVTVEPLDPALGQPEPLGGSLRIVCRDEEAPVVSGSGGSDGGLDGGNTGGASGDATGGASGTGGGAPSACGTADSCSNPTCADCNGDASDHCETDLREPTNCGSCSRSCGPGGSCDPGGACVAESMVQELASALAASEAGLAWIVPGAPQSGSVRYQPSGGQALTVQSGYTFSAFDRILLSGSELVFAHYQGIGGIPVPAGTPYGVVGAIQPDSVRLLGATNTHYYYLTLNEGNVADVVRRVDRSTLATVELVACAPVGTYDATIDGTGAVLLSTGTSLVRFEGLAGVSGCSGGMSPSTTLATASLTGPIWRVEAGASRAVFVMQSSPGFEVLAVPLTGGSAPVQIGNTVSSSSVGQTVFPLAMDGDTAIYVEAATLNDGRRRIVASSGSKTVPLSIAQDPVSAIAVGGGNVHWAEAGGIKKVVR